MNNFFYITNATMWFIFWSTPGYQSETQKKWNVPVMSISRNKVFTNKDKAIQFYLKVDDSEKTMAQVDTGCWKAKHDPLECKAFIKWIEPIEVNK